MHGYKKVMSAHVIGITLMLVAFAAVILAATYVFAATAEREPESRRSRSSSSPR